MRIKIFNLKKSQSHKNLYIIIGIALLILLPISTLSQSIKKEKIESLIKELTPTHSLKIIYKNISIFGFDVLDESLNRIISSKPNLYSGKKYYIVLFCMRKITEGKDRKENKLEKVKACLTYQTGGYFWSIKTLYLKGEQVIEDTTEDWHIGGIYKIQFAFKIPELALPGKYKLELFKEIAQLTQHYKLIIFDQIKINAKRPKIHKKEKIEDYDLPLKECLLNPALHQAEYIAFPWTGNAEFYIDEDLRNFKKIAVVAKGTPATGIYPLLKIYVDEKEIGSVYVNGYWNSYEFDLKLNRKNHIIKIRFANDGGGQGEDRNMYVNLIKLIR